MQRPSQILQMPSTQSPLASAIMGLQPMLDMLYKSEMNKEVNQPPKTQDWLQNVSQVQGRPVMGGAVPGSTVPQAEPAMDIQSLLRMLGLA